jgi:hypothetical protein
MTTEQKVTADRRDMLKLAGVAALGAVGASMVRPTEVRAVGADILYQEAQTARTTTGAIAIVVPVGLTAIWFDAFATTGSGGGSLTFWLAYYDANGSIVPILTFGSISGSPGFPKFITGAAGLGVAPYPGSPPLSAIGIPLPDNFEIQWVANGTVSITFALSVMGR